MESRKVERFFVDGEFARPALGPRVSGYWEDAEFSDLKKGDIFRLWESPGEPDHVVDGKPDVCVALSDSTPYKHPVVTPFRLSLYVSTASSRSLEIYL